MILTGVFYARAMIPTYPPPPIFYDRPDRFQPNHFELDQLSQPV